MKKSWKNHLLLVSLITAVVAFLAVMLGTVGGASADTKSPLKQTFELTGVKNGQTQTLIEPFDASNGNNFGFRFDPRGYSDLTLKYTLSNPTSNPMTGKGFVFLQDASKLLTFDDSNGRHVEVSPSDSNLAISYHHSGDSTGAYVIDPDSQDSTTVQIVQVSAKTDNHDYDGAPQASIAPGNSISISIPLKASSAFNGSGDHSFIYPIQALEYDNIGDPTAGTRSGSLLLAGSNEVQLSPTFIPIVKQPAPNSYKQVTDESLKDFLPVPSKVIKSASSAANLQAKIFDNQYVTYSYRSVDPTVFANVVKDGYYAPTNLADKNTDGNYDYTLNDGTLSILDSYEGDYPKTIDIPNVKPTTDGIEPAYLPLARAIDASDFKVDKTTDLNGDAKLTGLKALYNENGTAVDSPKTNKGLKVTVNAPAGSKTGTVTYTFNGVSKTVKVAISNPTPVTPTPNGGGSTVNGGTVTTPAVPSSPNTSNSGNNGSTSSDNNQIRQPALPNYATVKGTVVYAVKGIYMYRHADFKKSQRIAKYPKTKRVNRPMFVVINYVRSSNGTLRYRVRDAKTHKVGYITANSKFVGRAYYQTVPKSRKVTVISKKGVNAYKHASLTGKVKHYRKGAHLTVKKLVKHGLSTRYQLTNGRFITANKKLIIQGKY